jgi:ectoine hydroxylase-related dioxygenase (phytanoyl-CoA dioxygenase family)
MSFKKLFIYSLARFYYKNFLSLKVWKQKFAFKSKLDKKYAPFVKEIKQNGYTKISNFFTHEEVLKFRENIIENLDALDEKHQIEKSNEMIMYENNNKMIKKGYGYSRVFNLKLFNKQTEKFIENPLIKEIVSAYYGRECFPYHNTAQKSLPVDNIGLDWHIDDFLPRFKALVYLHDVELENGPFSFLKFSHKVFWQKLIKIHKMYTKNYNAESIFSEEEIRKLKFEKIICSGKAGDLFLVDVCGIHRGLPISKGHKRYALFNFYSPDRNG